MIAGMAIYPRAQFMPLPENDSQPRIRPTIVIVHTHVGNPTLDGARSALLPGGGEHHFNLRVGGTELAQYMNTEVRADNNYRANSFKVGGELCGAISIETGDKHNSGDPHLKLSFSDLDQFDALADLIAWCCRTHKIPVTRCTSPTSPGIGYHSMWGFNQRGDGEGTYGRYTLDDGRTARLNNPWTNVLGKTCPGPAKIEEFPRLLEAVARRLGATPPPNPIEDEDPEAEVVFAGEIRATVRSRHAMAVQQRLIAAGFKPVGGADGEFGVKSAEVCRQFQANRGLPPTGVVDVLTWRALGLPESSGPKKTVVLAGEGWMAIARRALRDESRWRELSALNGGRNLNPGDEVLLPVA
jgi:hypothetical protein